MMEAKGYATVKEVNAEELPGLPEGTDLKAVEHQVWGC
jgi:hypothetical protein